MQRTSFLRQRRRDKDHPTILYEVINILRKENRPMTGSEILNKGDFSSEAGLFTSLHVNSEARTSPLVKAKQEHGRYVYALREWELSNIEISERK